MRPVDFPLYSFARAIATMSGVIFLVSPDHDVATVYIINRVLNSDHGVAIAYSSALIAIMVLAIGSIRVLVGERDIGRRTSAPKTS